MTEKEIANYFKGQLQNLKSYINRMNWYKTKAKEYENVLYNPHTAQTDRITSGTSTYSLPVFNYDLASDREDCEKLASMYGSLIQNVISGVDMLPLSSRPSILAVYAKGVPIRQLASAANRHSEMVQRDMDNYIRRNITEKWVIRNRALFREVEATENNISISIHCPYPPVKERR